MVQMDCGLVVKNIRKLISVVICTKGSKLFVSVKKILFFFDVNVGFLGHIPQHKFQNLLFGWIHIQ